MYDNFIIYDIYIYICIYEASFHFCFMSGVCLWFALGLSRFTGNSMYDPSIYLCDTLIDGSVCESTGMAIYVSQGDVPARPSTFYPISHTQWAFVESVNSEYLGISISDTPNISAKFSGVFTAPKTATYTFSLVVTHHITDMVCYFDLNECPVFIEADFSYSGTGSDNGGSCYYMTTSECSSKDYYTYHFTMLRKLYLVSGNKYPLFAGMRHIMAVPQTTAPPWLKLTYYTKTSSQSSRVSSEAVAGLTGYSVTSSSESSYVDDSSVTDDTSDDVLDDVTSSASGSRTSAYTTYTDDDGSTTVSGSKKKSIAIIGGLSSGIIVVASLCAVAGWFILKKVKDGGKSSDRDSPSHSGVSKHSRPGSRGGSGNTSRPRSGSTSRPGSGSTSREGSVRTSRSISGSTSREGSVRTSRSRSGGTSRTSSGRTSRSRSGGTSRTGSGRTSREDYY